jgi:hypothetical protein
VGSGTKRAFGTDNLVLFSLKCHYAKGASSEAKEKDRRRNTSMRVLSLSYWLCEDCHQRKGNASPSINPSFSIDRSTPKHTGYSERTEAQKEQDRDMVEDSEGDGLFMEEEDVLFPAELEED